MRSQWLAINMVLVIVRIVGQQEPAQLVPSLPANGTDSGRRSLILQAAAALEQPVQDVDVESDSSIAQP